MRHMGDNTLFERLLGFRPEVDLAEGIHLTVEWFKQLPFSPEELISQEHLKNWE